MQTLLKYKTFLYQQNSLNYLSKATVHRKLFLHYNSQDIQIESELLLKYH